VVLALVLGVLAVGTGPASAAPTPAAKTFVRCTDLSNGIYISAGGALLHELGWANLGYNGKAKGGAAEPSSSTATITKSGSCAKRTRKTPANGTFVRVVVADTSTANGWRWSGHTYEIVGGAPITVHAWANVGKTSGTPVPVTANVLADLAAPGRCPATVAGCLYSRPANNTVFGGYNTTAKSVTTHYKVDSAGHPWPRTAAASKETVVDQTSINACQHLNCAPNGGIVNEYGVGYGVLHVDGWAADYPSAASVKVQLSLGGVAHVVPADRATSYVATGTAGNHGFAVDLPVAAGSYVLCATVLGTAPGATTQALGCSNVSVAGAAPARVHRPKVKAKGRHRLQVRWKRPQIHGSPIVAYIVKTNAGKKKQVKATRHKIVLKHLPGGRRVHVKVRAINGVGMGRFSKVSKSVTVR